MPLTRRQKEILSYLRNYIADHGYSPSFEEIGREFGIASSNGVFKHIKVLEERGFITRLSNRARSIQVIEPDQISQTSLPLLGRIAAGQPIDAITTPEWVDVPDNLLTRGNNFVLRVEGESMIEEHIQDGDLIIVEQREYADNGETVVALIDGEQTTLKKLYREGKHFRLQPANSDFQPLIVDEDRLRIQGVVVGLMRKY